MTRAAAALVLALMTSAGAAQAQTARQTVTDGSAERAMVVVFMNSCIATAPSFRGIESIWSDYQLKKQPGGVWTVMGDALSASLSDDGRCLVMVPGKRSVAVTTLMKRLHELGAEPALGKMGGEPAVLFTLEGLKAVAVGVQPDSRMTGLLLVTK